MVTRAPAWQRFGLPSPTNPNGQGPQGFSSQQSGLPAPTDPTPWSGQYEAWQQQQGPTTQQVRQNMVQQRTEVYQDAPWLQQSDTPWNIQSFTRDDTRYIPLSIWEDYEDPINQYFQALQTPNDPNSARYIQQFQTQIFPQIYTGLMQYDRYDEPIRQQVDMTGEAPGNMQMLGQAAGSLGNAYDWGRQQVASQMGDWAYQSTTGDLDWWERIPFEALGTVQQAATNPIGVPGGGWLFNDDGFRQWSGSHQDEVQQVYQQGYNGFTGGRAVWEYYIGQRGMQDRMASDVVMDPLSWAQLGTAGLARTGVRGMAFIDDLVNLPDDLLFRALGLPFQAAREIAPTVRYGLQQLAHSTPGAGRVVPEPSFGGDGAIGDWVQRTIVQPFQHGMATQRATDAGISLPEFAPYEAAPSYLGIADPVGPEISGPLATRMQRLGAWAVQEPPKLKVARTEAEVAIQEDIIRQQELAGVVETGNLNAMATGDLSPRRIRHTQKQSFLEELRRSQAAERQRGRTLADTYVAPEREPILPGMTADPVYPGTDLQRYDPRYTPATTDDAYRETYFSNLVAEVGRDYPDEVALIWQRAEPVLTEIIQRTANDVRSDPVANAEAMMKFEEIVYDVLGSERIPPYTISNVADTFSGWVQRGVFDPDEVVAEEAIDQIAAQSGDFVADRVRVLREFREENQLARPANYRGWRPTTQPEPTGDVDLDVLMANDRRLERQQQQAVDSNDLELARQIQQRRIRIQQQLEAEATKPDVLNMMAPAQATPTQVEEVDVPQVEFGPQMPAGPWRSELAPEPEPAIDFGPNPYQSRGINDIGPVAREDDGSFTEFAQGEEPDGDVYYQPPRVLTEEERKVERAEILRDAERQMSARVYQQFNALAEAYRAKAKRISDLDLEAADVERIQRLQDADPTIAARRRDVERAEQQVQAAVDSGNARRLDATMRQLDRAKEDLEKALSFFQRSRSASNIWADTVTKVRARQLLDDLLHSYGVGDGSTIASQVMSGELENLAEIVLGAGIRQQSPLTDRVTWAFNRMLEHNRVVIPALREKGLREGWLVETDKPDWRHGVRTVQADEMDRFQMGAIGGWEGFTTARQEWKDALALEAAIDHLSWLEPTAAMRKKKNARRRMREAEEFFKDLYDVDKTALGDLQVALTESAEAARIHRDYTQGDEIPEAMTPDPEWEAKAEPPAITDQVIEELLLLARLEEDPDVAGMISGNSYFQLLGIQKGQLNDALRELNRDPSRFVEYLVRRADTYSVKTEAELQMMTQGFRDFLGEMEVGEDEARQALENLIDSLRDGVPTPDQISDARYVIRKYEVTKRYESYQAWLQKEKDRLAARYSDLYEDPEAAIRAASEEANARLLSRPYFERAGLQSYRLAGSDPFVEGLVVPDNAEYLMDLLNDPELIETAGRHYEGLDEALTSVINDQLDRLPPPNTPSHEWEQLEREIIESADADALRGKHGHTVKVRLDGRPVAPRQNLNQPEAATTHPAWMSPATFTDQHARKAKRKVMGDGNLYLLPPESRFLWRLMDDVERIAGMGTEIVRNVRRRETIDQVVNGQDLLREVRKVQISGAGWDDLLSDKGKAILNRTFNKEGHHFAGKTYHEAWIQIESMLANQINLAAKLRQKMARPAAGEIDVAPAITIEEAVARGRLTEKEAEKLQQIESKFARWGDPSEWVRNRTAGSGDQGDHAIEMLTREEFHTHLSKELLDKQMENPRLRALLGDKYNAFISAWSAWKLLNPLNITRFLLQNLIGNTSQMALKGEFGAATQQFGMMRKAFSDHGFRKPEGWDKVVPSNWWLGDSFQGASLDMHDTPIGSLFAQAQIGLYNPRLNITSTSVITGDHDRLGKEAAKVVRQSWARKKARGYRDVAGATMSSIESSARLALWSNHLADQLIRRKPDIIQKAIAHNRSMLKGNALNDADIRQLFEEMGPIIGPVSVRADLERLGIHRGLSDGDARRFADRVARDWANMQNQAMEDALKRTFKVLFSYEYNNVDSLVRKFIPFHFWATRAIPFYAELAVKNPWLVNAYLNFTDALEKAAEDEGAPPMMRTAISILNSPFGYSLFFNPVTAVGMISAFERDFDHEPEGETTFGRIMRKATQTTGLQVYPWIGALANWAGMMGKSNQYLDPTGFQAERRKLGSFLQAAAANGMWPGESRVLDAPFEQWLVDTREFFSGLGFNQIESHDVTAGANVEMTYLMMDLVAERDGTPAGMPLSMGQMDEIVSAIDDPSSTLYQDALDLYASSGAFVSTLNSIVPGFIVDTPAGRADIDAMVDRAREAENESQFRRDNRAATEGEEYRPAEATSQLDRALLQGDLRTATREHAILEYQMTSYESVGTRNEQEIHETYTAIGQGRMTRPLQFTDNQGTKYNDFIPAETINAMDPDARWELANRWLDQVPYRRDEYESYKVKQNYYLATHPELAGYIGWRNQVYDLPSVYQYRTAVMAENPSAYHYFTDLQKTIVQQNPGISGPALLDRMDQATTSMAAYEAISGIQQTVYDKAYPTGPSGVSTPVDPSGYVTPATS